MFYPVCGIVHIKQPLQLIEKSSPLAAAGFLSRYLCGPLPYNSKINVLSASLNKTFPSFLPVLFSLNRFQPFRHGSVFATTPS